MREHRAGGAALAAVIGVLVVGGALAAMTGVLGAADRSGAERAATFATAASAAREVPAPTAGGSTGWPVTFQEEGLPSGTSWGLAYNQSGTPGGSFTTTNGSYVVSLADGIYTYVVQGTPGFAANPPNGTFFVNQSADTVFIAYSPGWVTFGEEGLPSGVSWGINISGAPGASFTTRAPSRTISLADGLYAFTVVPPAQYTASPSNGTFRVDGDALQINITFAPGGNPGTVYSVVFTEAGLGPGASWGMDVVGTTSQGEPVDDLARNTTAATESFLLENGSYAYVTWTPNASTYQTVTQTANFTVQGGPLSFAVAFAYAYPATFTAEGLPAGATWYVNLTAVPSGESGGSAVPAALVRYSFSGRTPTLVVLLPNGTYRVTVGSTDREWTPATDTGNLTVNGSPPPSLVFGPPSTSSSTNSPTPPEIAAVAGASVAVVALVGIALYARGRPPRRRAMAGAVDGIPAETETPPGGEPPDPLGDTF